MLSKLFILAQVVVAALAAPETAPNIAPETASETVPVEDYIQNLIGSELTGEALLLQYDKHYDGLPHPEKMAEKASYPDHVYQELLKHRSTLHK